MIGIKAVIARIIAVQRAGFVQGQDVAGVMAHPIGNLRAHHIGVEQPMAFRLGHVCAKPIKIRELDQLELPDLEEIGGTRHLRPFGVLIMVRPQKSLQQ